MSSDPPPSNPIVGFLQGVPTIVWIGAFLAGTFLYSLYKNQDSMLYYPQPPGLPFKRTSDNPKPFNSPREWNLDYEDLEIVTADRKKLHAWFVPAQPAVDRSKAPTVVFFHANAGNMGLRLPNVAKLVHDCVVNVLIFDYRGYGNSEDIPPNEEGLELDGSAVMAYLAQRQDIDKRKVFLFGRSLGGAVAVRTASNRPTEVTGGLLLENTFTSISEMVDHIFPLLSKVKWLVLRIKWPTVDLIGKLTQPMLFLSGEKDELVPPPMMRKLFHAAVNAESRQLYSIPHAGHNDAYQKGGEAYFARIRHFIYSTLAQKLGEEHGRPLRDPARMDVDAFMRRAMLQEQRQQQVGEREAAAGGAGVAGREQEKRAEAAALSEAGDAATEFLGAKPTLLGKGALLTPTAAAGTAAAAAGPGEGQAGKHARRKTEEELETEAVEHLAKAAEAAAAVLHQQAAEGEGKGQSQQQEAGEASKDSAKEEL